MAVVIPVAAVVIMCQAVVILMAVAEDTVRQESRSLTGFLGLVRDCQFYRERAILSASEIVKLRRFIVSSISLLVTYML